MIVKCQRGVLPIASRLPVMPVHIIHDVSHVRKPKGILQNITSSGFPLHCIATYTFDVMVCEMNGVWVVPICPFACMQRDKCAIWNIIWLYQSSWVYLECSCILIILIALPFQAGIYCIMLLPYAVLTSENNCVMQSKAIFWR